MKTRSGGPNLASEKASAITEKWRACPQKGIAFTDYSAGKRLSPQKKDAKTMELLSKKNLPSFVQQLTLAKASQTGDVRISLYMPNCRSHPKKMASQAKKLLRQTEGLLLKGLSPEDARARLEVLEQRIHDECGCQQAEGFAFFLDDEHLESHRLTLKSGPMAFVANSFHVLPLLRSLAHEPHYRLIAIENKGATIARMDHDGLKVELRAVFPNHLEKGNRLHERPSERALAEAWHNVDDFTGSLEALQGEDPRPLAVFGETRLRKRLIENIRPILNRPIFCQGQSADFALDALGQMADEAFELKLADESPVDIADVVAKAKKSDLLITELPDIAHAADEGRIETLVLGETHPLWGHRSADGSLVLHSEQTNHQDYCILDDALEEVILAGGTIIFAPMRNLRSLPSGVSAFAVAKAEQTEKGLH